MHSPSVPVCAAALVVLLLAPTRSAHAQSEADRATARHLGEQGSVALDDRDYVRAEDDFRRAEALFHAPTLTLGLARAQAGQKKYVEACESYQRVVVERVTSNPIFRKALDDAQRELAAIEAKRARVTVRVSGAGTDAIAGVTALLDGARLRPEALGIERFLDPGDHVVTASADGFVEGRESFHVGEGEGRTVTLTLARVAAPVAVASGPALAAPVESHASGGARRPLMIASFAAGGAGLVLGAVTGGLAVAKHGTIAGYHCGGSGQPLCSTSQETSDIATYHDLGVYADIGFAVFGAFTVTGAVLWLTAPKDAPPTTGLTVRPYLGARSGGLEGKF
jgi:hypothetical protein